MRARGLFSTLVIAAALSSDGQPLPATVIADVPVSAAVYTPPPYAQGLPSLASNGVDILAAWNDERSGERSIIATRLDHSGNVLDPLGTVIDARAGLYSLIWNGDTFAAFVASGNETHAILELSARGAVLERRELDSLRSCRFLASGWTGTDSRVVFRCSPSRLLFLNGHGEVVSEQSWIGSGGLASTTESEWILLQSSFYSAPGTQQVVSIERRTRDGNLLDRVTSVLPHGAVNERSRLAAGSDGLLVVTSDRSRHDVTGYRFEASGTYTGAPIAIDPGPAVQNGTLERSPSIVRDGNRYLVSWATPPDLGHSWVMLAEVGADGNLMKSRRISEWVGVVNGVALAKVAGSRFLFFSAIRLFTSTHFDTWFHRVSAILDADEARLLTASATLQGAGRIAAGSNGYLAVWSENGPDRFRRLFARRFSRSGVAQDAQPVSVMERPQDLYYPALEGSSVTAVGDEYLVAFSGERYGLQLRRLSAVTGSWLDSQAVTVSDMPQPVFASNGRTVLAAWAANCGPVPTGPITAPCVRTRLILSGEAITMTAPTIAGSGVMVTNEVAVASNGDEYLVAWVEGFRPMGVFGPVGPHSLYVVRVRADGTVRDEKPLALEFNDGYHASPSIAWDGQSWVIVWQSGQGIRGARVSRDGSMREAPSVVHSGNGEVIRAKVTSHGSSVLLAVRTLTWDRWSRRGEWSVTNIPSTSPLAAVPYLPQAIIAAHPDEQAGSLELVSGPGGVAWIYDRVADESYGSVSRVFLKVLGDGIARRRSVSR